MSERHQQDGGRRCLADAEGARQHRRQRGHQLHSGALDLTLWSDSDSAGGGYIRVTNAAITTNGGDVVMGGGADPAANPAIGNATVDDGVTLNNGDISTGAGNISIRGRGQAAEMIIRACRGIAVEWNA